MKLVFPVVLALAGLSLALGAADLAAASGARCVAGVLGSPGGQAVDPLEADCGAQCPPPGSSIAYACVEVSEGTYCWVALQPETAAGPGVVGGLLP